MSILKKLLQLLKIDPNHDRYAHWVPVKCDHCGEVIRARVDLRHQLSREYEPNSDKYTFICRKTIIGNGPCFRPIEIKLIFNSNLKVIDRQIQGGQFVDD